MPGDLAPGQEQTLTLWPQEPLWMSNTCTFIHGCCFKAGLHVTQTDLEVTIQPRMTPSFGSSCLHSPKTGIIGLCHYTWWFGDFLPSRCLLPDLCAGLCFFPLCFSPLCPVSVLSFLAWFPTFYLKWVSPFLTCGKAMEESQKTPISQRRQFFLLHSP